MFWTEFLRGLRDRGLAGVQLVISDSHRGLTRAIDTVLAGAAWQRCRTVADGRDRDDVRPRQGGGHPLPTPTAHPHPVVSNERGLIHRHELVESRMLGNGHVRLG